jgi:hypothetical protein
MPLHQNWQDMGNQIAKAIAKAWVDDNFKKRLLANPQKTLEGEGIQFAPGETVQIDQTTSTWRIEPSSATGTKAVVTIPLPPKPDDVTTEELEKMISSDDVVLTRFCVKQTC